MMRSILIAALALIWPLSSTAGIETELFLKQYDACTVRVQHDATPSSKTGVIVIRVFTEQDGVQARCLSLDKKHITQSLGTALARYKKRADLKPVTSLMLGRLVNYPWIRTSLEAKAGAAPVKKLSREQFHAFVLKTERAAPFREALEEQGFRVTGANCEKLMFYRNGAPQDAMCWLVIE